MNECEQVQNRPRKFKTAPPLYKFGFLSAKILVSRKTKGDKKMNEKKIYLRKIFKILKVMTINDIKRMYSYVMRYFYSHYN